MALGFSSELKIKVDSDKDCMQMVSVEWPVDKVKKEIEKAFHEVQGQAKLPGFRPGKTPLELIKKSYQETAFSRAQDQMLREGVTEALRSKHIHPVQTPVVQSMEFAPDKPFQFKFQVEVPPKFKVSGYSGLKLTKTVKTIKDDDIKKALDHVADMNAKLEESKDTELIKNHFAVIDYEGTLNEKPIDGAKATNFLLNMSAPQTIAGLTEGLMGCKVGEKRDVTVTFPADSPAKELAGKEAVFHVTLQAIKEKNLPPVDDDLAKDLGLTSVDDLKSRIKGNMEAEQEKSARQGLESQINTKVLEENKFPVPPSLLQEQIDHLGNRYRDNLKRQGLAEADQKKALEGKQADFKIQAEKDVRLAYIINSIGENEKIEVRDDEFDARVKEIVEGSGAQDKTNVEKALKGELHGRLQNEIREKKIIDWIISRAKIKTVEGETK